MRAFCIQNFGKRCKGDCYRCQIDEAGNVVHSETKISYTFKIAEVAVKK